MILKISDRFKNRRVSYFNDVSVKLKYDAVSSTFQLNYYFDPNNIEHKELSCVGHYHECTLHNDNDELILTGTILSIRFTSEAKKTLVSISGYSLPGVFEDCEIPPYDRNGAEVPGYLQSDSLLLKDIVQKYADLFQIGVVIHPLAMQDMLSQYTQSDGKATQSVKSYFTELVSQKNIIISHDQFGRIVFTKPVRTKPIFHFETDNLPATKMALSFNGQGMHTYYLAMAQEDIEDGAQANQSSLVLNPYIPNRRNVFRPKVATMSSKSDEDLDTEKAALNLRARELKALTLTIEMDRWELNGKIVRPGVEISVTNPEIYLYRKTEWFVESVDLDGDTEKQTAVLTCVPPEAYTGGEPTYPFKGYNLHPIE